MRYFLVAFRMLGLAISPGRPSRCLAQLVLARVHLLPQVKFPALRIPVRRTWEKESRRAIHAVKKGRKGAKRKRERCDQDANVE